MKKQKVFCIGFHKTGTTSIGKALEFLGYNNCHGAGELRAKYGDQNFLKMLVDGELDGILEFVAAYDSFNDNPWFLIYEQLVETFPDAQYILTVRSKEKWLKSAKRYFGQSTNPIRKFIYGKPSIEGNELIYLNRYINHNDAVIEYFKSINKELLILDLEEDNNWKSLSTFLNRDIPTVPFPHLNKSKE